MTESSKTKANHSKPAVLSAEWIAPVQVASAEKGRIQQSNVSDTTSAQNPPLLSKHH